MSAKHRAAEASDPASGAVGLRFVTKGLSPEEVAAATAVLTAALRQNRRSEPSAPAPASAWSRSTRGLRQPLHGDWRGFTR